MPARIQTKGRSPALYVMRPFCGGMTCTNTVLLTLVRSRTAANCAQTVFYVKTNSPHTSVRMQTTNRFSAKYAIRNLLSVIRNLLAGMSVTSMEVSTSSIFPCALCVLLFAAHPLGKAVREMKGAFLLGTCSLQVCRKSVLCTTHSCSRTVCRALCPFPTCLK